MKRKLIGLLFCVVIASFFASCGAFGEAFGIGGGTELDARVMSVFRVDGDDVSLWRYGDTSRSAVAGMGLHEGYVVSTWYASFCYISLDAASIVKMDEFTDVSVNQLTDRLLRINVDRGQVLINVQDQEPDHLLEAIIGNTVITVRGTLFLAGVYSGGEAIVITLDGSVYVNDVQLDAGFTMRMYDGAVMDYDLSPTDFRDMDVFQLNAIVDNRSRLLASGSISHSDLDMIADLMREEEEATEPIPAPTPEPVPTLEPTPTPTPTPEPTPFATRTATIRSHHIIALNSDGLPDVRGNFSYGTRVTVDGYATFHGIRYYRATGTNQFGNQVTAYIGRLNLAFD